MLIQAATVVISNTTTVSYTPFLHGHEKAASFNSYSLAISYISERRTLANSQKAAVKFHRVTRASKYRISRAMMGVACFECRQLLISRQEYSPTQSYFDAIIAGQAA